MAIEESKDLSSLGLDELIKNLKVHEVVMERDFETYKGKKEQIKSIIWKARKESSDDETSTSTSDDEEYAMAVRNFKKFFRRKDQKAFIGGSWSDSENDAEDKTNDETCLMAQSSNEVCLRTCLEPNKWIKDSGCSKHMTGNKSLFSIYKAYDRDSKPTKTSMSTEIKLTKDDKADFVDRSKYQGTKMPSEHQQEYKKTRSYASKLYNDPNMSDLLRDIYRALESRYVHEGRIIDPSFYNDLSDDPVAKFTAIGLDELEKTLEQIEPFNSRLPGLDDIRNRDHTQAIIGLMFYCLENRQPFNLAYFIVRTMYFFRDRRDKILPYGMILTHLFENLKANMAQGSFDELYKLVPSKMSSLRKNNPRDLHPKELGM
nr:alpha/beta hydrolases superfamily protein [Tanacetum cinerariifolium]